MSHKTPSAIFSVIYCLPTLYTVVRWALRRPIGGGAPVILGMAFGGLAVLILTCALVLPNVLSRLGQADRAARWRRAATRAIVFGVVFSFVWTILVLPAGSLAARIAVALAACAVALAALWWADERWLHLDIFKR